MKLDPFKNIILLSSELDPQASEERVEHRPPGVSNPLPDSDGGLELGSQAREDR